MELKAIPRTDCGETLRPAVIEDCNVRVLCGVYTSTSNPGGSIFVGNRGEWLTSSLRSGTGKAGFWAAWRLLASTFAERPSSIL